MDKAGVLNLEKGQLHHIVCRTDKQCGPARGKLKQLGVGINSPANGVYLAQHKGRHIYSYCVTVNDRLMDVKSTEELVQVLNQIREELLKGKISL